MRTITEQDGTRHSDLAAAEQWDAATYGSGTCGGGQGGAEVTQPGEQGRGRPSGRWLPLRYAAAPSQRDLTGSGPDATLVTDSNS